MSNKKVEKKIRGYALKNAIAYGGKANPGSVISAMFNEGLKKEDMKEYGKIINDVVKEINKLSVPEQKDLFKDYEEIISVRVEREGLPDLPGVPVKGVIMRFAPSASGPMHVMHAIIASLSYDYVRKYGGKMIVRIEDTNPNNTYPNADKLLTKDAEWLFKKKAHIFVQSDRMELYYKYAEKLIKGEHAYVCTCDGDEFREFSKKQQDCPCRSLKAGENLERWNDMFSEEGFKEGEAVLRFRTPDELGGMKNKNPAMRDFPLARINETPHPRQKKKYRVWPLMNLAVSVDDIDMKMTHIIRGKDHMDNAKRQELVFASLGKKYPWTGFLGRYHFKGLELSTTKFKEGIASGKYNGWDDPKLPTVASLKKRGYKPEAFWKMAEHIGLSAVDKVIDKKDFFNELDKFNKEK